MHFLKKHNTLFRLLLIVNSLVNCSCTALHQQVKYLDNFDVSTLSDITDCRLPQNVQELTKKIRLLQLEIKEYEKPLSEKDCGDIITRLRPLINDYKKCLLVESVIPERRDYLNIPPKTKITLNLETYCLYPFAATPEIDEPYILTAKDPKIPLYSQIMHYTNASEIVKQGLLWNLSNNVAFEDLSAEEKALLLKIDIKAYLKVNNYLKNTVKERIIQVISQYLPQADEMRAMAGLIKGKAYEYQVYAHALNRLTSKIRKPVNVSPVKADGYNLYTLITTNGYSNASVTFLNFSDVPQVINSYFIPVRKDVQPLGFEIPAKEESYNALKQAFGELLADLFELVGFDLEPGDSLTIEQNPDKIIDLFIASMDAAKAFEQTRKEFGINRENDMSDAFRHAYWNALMERDIGDDFVIEIANNHELNPNTPQSRQMDLWNNKVGRDIAKLLMQQKIYDDETYAAKIMEDKHKLKIIK